MNFIDSIKFLRDRLSFLYTLPPGHPQENLESFAPYGGPMQLLGFLSRTLFRQKEPDFGDCLRLSRDGTIRK